MAIPAGPYRTLTTVEGNAFPYYVVPFDAEGLCAGPLTQQHLLEHCAGHSDIFVFSHGWNNDWSVATERYQHFIAGFQEQRRKLNLPVPADYKPLLVGIFWPSQALAWFDSEVGPGFAAGDPAGQDADAERSSRLVADIAAALPGDRRARFFELAQAKSLNETEARELAAILASILGGDDESGDTKPPSAHDLLTAAAAFAEPEPDYDAVGAVGASEAEPQGAFGVGDVLKALDPRQLLKPFTVWQMKDRAGMVGSGGVSALLAGLLERSSARIHLLGHSYGCKVVMSALCSLPEGHRKVHSVLLLQPAVSQYAFAPQVPEAPGVSGGFVVGLKRVAMPVVATFSANDEALTKMFHLALRRESDLGEQPVIAGGSPSKYAALGGYGPQASGESIVDILDPKQSYAFGGGNRIVGIRATRTISGHGDISNPSTWWLAYSVATGQP
jgi:hypothetical protein